MAERNGGGVVAGGVRIGRYGSRSGVVRKALREALREAFGSRYGWLENPTAASIRGGCTGAQWAGVTDFFGFSGQGFLAAGMAGGWSTCPDLRSKQNRIKLAIPWTAAGCGILPQPVHYGGTGPARGWEHGDSTGSALPGCGTPDLAMVMGMPPGW